MNILTIDIGGSHVKALASGESESRRFDSGEALTPQQMVAEVKSLTEGWAFDVIAIGYPGQVVRNAVVAEPCNLGTGWVNFDFAAAFGVPVRLINDAAMQALGSYSGNGNMLFLGLGTGLGSTMIVDGNIAPMELAHLPYRKGKSYEDYLSDENLERIGKKKWRKHVERVVELFRAALQPDEIVIGGGNAKHLKSDMPGIRLGDNDNAFTGGFRLWSTTYTKTSKPTEDIRI